MWIGHSRKKSYWKHKYERSNEMFALYVQVFIDMTLPSSHCTTLRVPIVSPSPRWFKTGLVNIWSQWSHYSSFPSSYIKLRKEIIVLWNWQISQACKLLWALTAYMRITHQRWRQICTGCNEGVVTVQAYGVESDIWNWRRKLAFTLCKMKLKGRAANHLPTHHAETPLYWKIFRRWNKPQQGEVNGREARSLWKTFRIFVAPGVHK